MRYTRRTSVHIHLNDIAENLRRIQERFPASVRTCAVVKADGYGHGAVAVARRLEAQADFFAVAAASEASELREAGITRPILILGYCWPEDYAEMIEKEVRLTVFKEADARLLSETALRLGVPARVHIKVDTGMSRIGFMPGPDAVETVRRIRTLPGLEVEGIFTHFARADEEDKDFTEEQLFQFQDFIRRVEEGEKPIPVHHCANSAASMEMPETWMDMARVGISLYGLYPSDEVDHETLKLRPALEWKSEIVFVKDLEMGSGISYGHTRIAFRDLRVATIPVGYADGYPRSLSNCGYVLIHGKPARILGRVCMDQMMVDVTEIPEAAEGDEVTLVGHDGEAELPVEALSELSGRFNYEFVCEISRRVPRIYTE
ncbi:MAG: alanine racemase [Lachnospiraceae bacterium]|nr:alanine racemase [Lachnospiraceae bacterium]